MPFNPPASPNLVPELLTNFFDRESDMLTRWEQAQQRRDFATGLSQALQASPDGTLPTVLGRFQALLGNGVSPNSDQLSGFLSGWEALQQNKAQQEKLDFQKDELGFVPTQADFDRATAAGYSLLPSGHGRYRAVATGGTTQPNFAPSADEMAKGNSLGLTWLPTSRGEGRWIQRPTAPGAVTGPLRGQLNSLGRQVGKFGLTTDDLNAIDADTPNVVKYVDPSGAALSADQAMSRGPDAFAVGNANGVQFRIPLPTFQTFINERNAIARSLGSSPSGGAGTQTALTTPPQSSPGAVNPSVVLTQARAKVKAGADPAAVKLRLQQLGVDPSQL